MLPQRQLHLSVGDMHHTFVTSTGYMHQGKGAKPEAEASSGSSEMSGSSEVAACCLIRSLCRLCCTPAHQHNPLQQLPGIRQLTNLAPLPAHMYISL